MGVNPLEKKRRAILRRIALLIPETSFTNERGALATAMRLCLALLIIIGFVSPARAQEARELCPARPGLGTPTCIVDRGKVLVELGVADFTHDAQDDVVTDTWLAGDLLVRFGISPNSELQIGWTAFGAERERDRASRRVSRSFGSGDVTLAFKRGIANPDGKGRSAAVQAVVSLPTGGGAIGAGDWGVGVLAPLQFPITDAISFQLTPEVSAAVDEDRTGRHLSYGTVAGLAFDLSDVVGLSVEASAFDDRDPAGQKTVLLSSASLAVKVGDDLQLDLGGVVGLNRESPDAELYVGISHRF